MTIRLTASACLFHMALSVLLIAITTPVAAQLGSKSQPACACGPSVLPSYTPPYPQPAYRPLAGSPRASAQNSQGVTYRQGDTYHEARTGLGSSSHEAVVGPALWSGFYLGAHGGYSQGSVSAGDNRLGTADVNGAFAGIHLGRSWQFGALVLGVEGDATKSWADGRRDFASGFGVAATRDWTGSARGRVGYAFGDALVFATAGVAMARQTISASTGGTTWRGSETSYGYVYGGGLEFQVLPKVSVRGEVLRYEFNDRDMPLAGGKTAVKLDETVIRGGVSFHFN